MSAETLDPRVDIVAEMAVIEAGEKRMERRVARGEEVEVYCTSYDIIRYTSNSIDEKSKWTCMWDVISLIAMYDPPGLEPNIYLLKKRAYGKDNYRFVFYNGLHKVLSIPCYKRGGSMVLTKESVGKSVRWWYDFLKGKANIFSTIDAIRYALKDTPMEMS